MNNTTRNLLTFSALLLLGACDGPWNMDVTDHVADRSLWVSSVQAAGRGFDTLWIEDNAPLATVRDETVPVAVAGSTVKVYQDSAGVRDTVVFEASSTRPRAWIVRAADAGKRVRWDATLRMDADVLLADGTRRSLTAESYTPAFYALADSFSVPVEALHPRLSNGTFRMELANAGGDTAKIAALVLGLDPTLAFFARWHLTSDDLIRYAQGNPVMRKAAMKGAKLDTLWYISDMAPVQSLAIDGAPSTIIPAEYRQWVFKHSIDPKRFGGMVLMQGFDTSRSRIFGSIYKMFGNTFTIKDSSGFFQRGGTRSWLVAPKVYKDLPGWPDSALLANNFYGYTGKNRIYSWSVDSLYYEFYRTVTGNTGDGQYSVTNIKGGKGFFTGAGLDSVAFDLEAAFADTVAVPRLRALWCDSLVSKQSRGESSNIPKSQVTQFCGDK